MIGGKEIKFLKKKNRENDISCFDLKKELKFLKKKEETKWLSEVYSQSLENAITNLDVAFQNFFRGLKRKQNIGYPEFKSKFKSRPSVQFRSGVKIDKVNSLIFIPGPVNTKIGWIKIVLHKKIDFGEVKTCTISKNAANEYYISILIRNKNSSPIPKKEIINNAQTIGVDWGIKTFATLSNGDKIDNSKQLETIKKLEGIINKEKQILSRRKGPKKENKQTPSKRFLKQKKHIAKIQNKINNVRKEFIHNTTFKLIKKYDTICVEDLNIKGMTKSSKGTKEKPGKNVKQKSGLNKSILRFSPGEFYRQLDYKGEWNGKNILKADRFFASSKTCPKCGWKKKDLKLENREWKCERCHDFNDRDLKAAINIKNFCLHKVL